MDRNRGSEHSLPRRLLSSPLTELPVLPGLYLDAHHLAADQSCTGRAWFDVIGLADGRVALLVGSVVEPAIPIAAFTGQVRAVLATLLAGDPDLVAVLQRLSNAWYGDDAADPTTVCVAVVDPIDGRVQYSTCGNSPPLVVTRGSTRALPSTGGRLLPRNQPVSIGTTRLERDEVLVLHTDGFPPESRRAAATGSADFPDPRELATSARTDEVCRTTVDEMLRSGARADFAVLAVQQRPAVPRLEMTVPAIVGSVETVGEAVDEWLARLRSSVEDGAVMALAVGEAMANAIQHAFVGQRVGSVTVEARLLADGVLTCSVSDDGCWRSPESSRTRRSGRGLGLMARLCDRMMVHREPTGTVVELRRRLHHPVVRSAATSPSG